MLELQDCLGRIFTKEQLPTELLKIAQRLPSVFEKKGELFCSRCHSQIDKERNLLPIGAYYCRECILLGRVRSDEDLYYFSQEFSYNIEFEMARPIDRISGKSF